MIQSLHELDCGILKLIYSSDHPVLLNHFMGVFSDYRIWIGIVTLLLASAAKFRDKRYLYSLFWILVCIGASDLLSAHVLKPYFERVRPCLGNCISTLRSDCGSYYSFPSNHATNAMTMATVGLFFVPSGAVKAVMFLTALFVGLSRVYFGVHYPGDVLGGFVFGATISGGLSLLLLLAVRHYSRRRLSPSQ